MTNKTIETIIKILEKETRTFTPPLAHTIIKKYGNTHATKDTQVNLPFLILITCLLSLRSKDSVTIHVCHDLFSLARTPEEITKLPLPKLKKIIFKIGFYNTKARVLHNVSKIILEKYNNQVPRTREELLTLPGVGRKTANLVLGLAYNIPAICVDIHVHRIANRLGIIKTKTPEQTEHALEKILPKKHWIIFNKLLVSWGQNICTPRSPKCPKCTIKHLCKKIITQRSMEQQ